MTTTRSRCDTHPHGRAVRLVAVLAAIALLAACSGGGGRVPGIDEIDAPDTDPLIPEGFEDACSSSADPAVHAFAVALGYCNGGGPSVPDGIGCDDEDSDGYCDDCVDINGDGFCDDCTDYDGDGACDPCLSVGFDGYCSCFDYDDNGTCDDDLNNDCGSNDIFVPCEPELPCETDADWDGICDDEDPCIDIDWDGWCDLDDPCVDGDFNGICDNADCYDFDLDGDCDPFDDVCVDINGDGICYDPPGPLMPVPPTFDFGLLAPGECVDQGSAVSTPDGIWFDDAVVYTPGGAPRLIFGSVQDLTWSNHVFERDEEGRPQRELIDTNRDGYADREVTWSYDALHRLVAKTRRHVAGTAQLDDDTVESWTYEYFPGQSEAYREHYRWRYGDTWGWSTVTLTLDGGDTVINHHDYSDDGLFDATVTVTWSADHQVMTRGTDFEADGIDDETERQTFHQSGALLERAVDFNADGEVDYADVAAVTEGAFGLEQLEMDLGNDGVIDRAETYLYDAEGVLTDRIDAHSDGQLWHTSFDAQGRQVEHLNDRNSDGVWGYAEHTAWHEGDVVASTRSEWDDTEDGLIDAWNELIYDEQGRKVLERSGTTPEEPSFELARTYETLCLTPPP
jgi:hypothetical protein